MNPLHRAEEDYFRKQILAEGQTILMVGKIITDAKFRFGLQHLPAPLHFIAQPNVKETYTEIKAKISQIAIILNEISSLNKPTIFATLQMERSYRIGQMDYLYRSICFDLGAITGNQLVDSGSAQA